MVSDGLLRDRPDTAAVTDAKIIAGQAAVIAAPPLLALWFGWDVWFAVVGLLEVRAHARRGANKRTNST